MATQTTTRDPRPAAAAPARVRLSRWRINAVLLLCLLLMGRVLLRLGELQVVRHAELRVRLEDTGRHARWPSLYIARPDGKEARFIVVKRETEDAARR